MSDLAIGVDVGGVKALALMVARDGHVEREGYDDRPTITVTTSLVGPGPGAMGATLVAFEGA